MRVVLVIPPSPFLINPRKFLPLGRVYLSSVLNQLGHEVEVIDLAGGEPMPDVEGDVYGISANTATFPYALRVLKEIKENDEKARVIIGGPIATIEPHTCLEAGFDQVVVGEGERDIAKIASGCREKIIKEPFIENLDQIPFPDRDAIIDNYYDELDGDPCTNIITSRGCPYQCVFCVKIWGSVVRYHSADYVLKEAKLIRERYGIRALWFFDDELLLNKERDFKIFRGLRELGMIYRIFTRSNLVDKKVAKLLADTGCREVLIGVESGSNRIKRIVKKGTTREVDKRAIKLLYEHGIKVKATFIVGLPGETHETLQETWQFCEEIEPYVADFDFSVLVVYPNTEIYNNPEKFDIKFDLSYHPYKTKPGEYICTVSTSSLSSEEILRWRDALEKRFKPKERLD